MEEKLDYIEITKHSVDHASESHSSCIASSHSNAAVHEWMREFVTQHPILKSFMIGSLSGTCSSVLFQPLDLMKTRIQNQHTSALSAHGEFMGASRLAFTSSSPGAKNLGMTTVLFDIVREEKIVGLWRGTVPSLVRCVPGVGIYFSSLHTLQDQFFKRTGETLSPLQAVSVGFLARALTTTILIPITVIKTRFESGMFQYNGIRDALNTTWRGEGVRGLASGLSPTILRDAPFSGLYFMFYSQLKKQKSHLAFLQSKPQLDPVATFTCGLIAGLSASFITHPADVLKTKMQLHPKECKNLVFTFKYVKQRYGYRGFLKGLAPRMMRRTLMAAMAWTLFESLMQKIGLK